MALPSCRFPEVRLQLRLHTLEYEAKPQTDALMFVGIVSGMRPDPCFRPTPEFLQNLCHGLQAYSPQGHPRTSHSLGFLQTMLILGVLSN